MKISSSIGVTGGQQTTMAATFAEVWGMIILGRGIWLP